MRSISYSFEYPYPPWILSASSAFDRAASEAAKANAEEALRIHGGYGYSKEYEIERIYRDAPLLLIGEGTSEIQKMVIGRKLLERNKI